MLRGRERARHADGGFESSRVLWVKKHRREQEAGHVVNAFKLLLGEHCSPSMCPIWASQALTQLCVTNSKVTCIGTHHKLVPLINTCIWACRQDMNAFTKQQYSSERTFLYSENRTRINQANVTFQ
jgi:Fe-S-cluster-containing dehydrogenase component